VKTANRPRRNPDPGEARYHPKREGRAFRAGIRVAQLVGEMIKEAPANGDRRGFKFTRRRTGHPSASDGSSRLEVRELRRKPMTLLIDSSKSNYQPGRWAMRGIALALQHTAAGRYPSASPHTHLMRRGHYASTGSTLVHSPLVMSDIKGGRHAAISRRDPQRAVDAALYPPNFGPVIVLQCPGSRRRDNGPGPLNGAVAGI
jgi:hypothetical protein